MSDQPDTRTRRMLTHALAELDLYFNYGKDPSERPLWSLNILAEGQTDPVPFAIRIEHNFVIVMSPLSSTPQAIASERLSLLLKLNAMIAKAKVALAHEGYVVVWGELDADRISAPDLRAVIGGVHEAAVAARRVIASGQLPAPQPAEAKPS